MINARQRTKYFKDPLKNMHNVANEWVHKMGNDCKLLGYKFIVLHMEAGAYLPQTLDGARAREGYNFCEVEYAIRKIDKNDKK